MDTTNQQSLSAPGRDFSSFTALGGEVQLYLSGKLATGEVANFFYTDDPRAPAHFMKNVYDPQRVHPIDLWVTLFDQEMPSLLAALKEAEKNISPGLDPLCLRSFIHELTQAIENQPSTRFNNARFSDIAQDRNGAIVGHFVLGVDVAGMIHDAHEIVTVEQHVVPMPPGHFRRLSHADRASLIAALENFINTAQPPANPLWNQVLADLQK